MLGEEEDHPIFKVVKSIVLVCFFFGYILKQEQSFDLMFFH